MTSYDQACTLVSQFLDWQTRNLKVNIREDKESRVIIETPFARADGHAFDIEVCFLDDGIVRFTDIGDTLDELWMQGITLNSSTIDQIERIARRFRVKLSVDDYVLRNDGDGGARQFQDLVSAILAISALIDRRRETVQTEGDSYGNTEVPSLG